MALFIFATENVAMLFAIFRRYQKGGPDNFRNSVFAPCEFSLAVFRGAGLLFKASPPNGPIASKYTAESETG